ncbi:MAG: hypothetical protein WAT19_06590 [Ferruginibacter sp.]
MERVKTLAEKLVQQLKDNAPAGQLLLTVQMLQSELMHLNAHTGAPAGSVSVQTAPLLNNLAPNFEELLQAPEPQPIAASISSKPAEEEKIIEVLQVDEAELEAELEEIKRKAEEINKISVQNKPTLLFDPIDDIPTMAHQQYAAPEGKAEKELHEVLPTDRGTSLNDKLKQGKMELSDTLGDAPIKDLKKAIGVNDRFVFIRELFRGDENMYERSIKTINGFSIFPEAEYWIRRELKLKLGWNDKNEIVKLFDQLVRRRFL